MSAAGSLPRGSHRSPWGEGTLMGAAPGRIRPAGFCHVPGPVLK